MVGAGEEGDGVVGAGGACGAGGAGEEGDHVVRRMGLDCRDQRVGRRSHALLGTNVDQAQNSLIVSNRTQRSLPTHSTKHTTHVTATQVMRSCKGCTHQSRLASTRLGRTGLARTNQDIPQHGSNAKSLGAMRYVRQAAREASTIISV